MSYVRFGGGSDVYVYLSVGDFLDCCGCTLQGTSFHAGSTQIMVDHLKEHIAAGHQVPDYVIPSLIEDDEINFP